jgi:hypothetical protein
MPGRSNEIGPVVRATPTHRDQARSVASFQRLIDITVQLLPELVITLMHLAVTDLFVRNGHPLAEPGKFPLVIFKHPEPITDNFTHRAIAARGDLLVDEALEVIS